MINRPWINEWCKISHEIAIEKGWWDDNTRSFGDLISLMHSELSEALEEYRDTGPDQITRIYYKDGKPEGVPIELADLLIRVFDMCGRYNIDLQGALEEKTIYNRSRPYRHGGKHI